MGYKAQNIEGFAPVILIALEARGERLRLLVDPNWQQIVCADEWDHVIALLADFSERARDDPEYLFKQLCSLDLGPLITCDFGSQVSRRQQLMEIGSHFVSL